MPPIDLGKTDDGSAMGEVRNHVKQMISSNERRIIEEIKNMDLITSLDPANLSIEGRIKAEAANVPKKRPHTQIKELKIRGNVQRNGLAMPRRSPIVNTAYRG